MVLLAFRSEQINHQLTLTTLALLFSDPLYQRLQQQNCCHLENSFEMAEKNCSSLQKITDLLTLRITQNIIVNHLQLELAIIQNE